MESFQTLQPCVWRIKLAKQNPHTHTHTHTHTCVHFRGVVWAPRKGNAWSASLELARLCQTNARACNGFYDDIVPPASSTFDGKFPFPFSATPSANAFSIGTLLLPAERRCFDVSENDLLLFFIAKWGTSKNSISVRAAFHEASGHNDTDGARLAGCRLYAGNSITVRPSHACHRVSHVSHRSGFVDHVWRHQGMPDVTDGIYGCNLQTASVLRKQIEF